MDCKIDLWQLLILYRKSIYEMYGHAWWFVWATILPTINENPISCGFIHVCSHPLNIQQKLFANNCWIPPGASFGGSSSTVWEPTHYEITRWLHTYSQSYKKDIECGLKTLCASTITVIINNQVSIPFHPRGWILNCLPGSIQLIFVHHPCHLYRVGRRMQNRFHFIK